MSAIRFASKSPRKKREVTALLESIPFEEKADREKVVALCLEQLVAAKRAELLFQKLFAEGLRNKSPQLLLSAVQAYQDQIALLVAGRDENLAKILESRSTTVTARIANRMTDGEFAKLTYGETSFADVEAKRALAERLRELGDDALLAYNDAEEATASVQELLDETTLEAPTSPAGPRI
jgi:hypothetical protein